RNQLQQVTTVKRGAENSAKDDHESYLYGSDGRRVVKQSIQHTNNTTQTTTVTYLPGLELRTQYSGQQLTEDFQVITLGAAGRAQVRVLLWEQGKPEGIDNAQLRYSFDNQIGSSLLELDAHGDIISQEEYYPFGGTAVFSARNTMEAKYKTVRYSGKERDATGLYYYGHRYYQPWLGRWLSADPAGTIDGLNLYRMVRNNPVTLMDEDGLAPIKYIGSEKNGGPFELMSLGYNDLASLGRATKNSNYITAKKIMTETYAEANNILANVLSELKNKTPEAESVIDKFFGTQSESEKKNLFSELTSKFESIKNTISEIRLLAGLGVTFIKDSPTKKVIAFVSISSKESRIYIEPDKFLSYKAIDRAGVIIHESSHLHGTYDYWYTNSLLKDMKINSIDSSYFDKLELTNEMKNSSKFIKTNRIITQKGLKSESISDKSNFMSAAKSSDMNSAMTKFMTSDKIRLKITTNNADTIANLAIALSKQYILKNRKS
uniref:RHS repeat-associated core domain-containing protein n=1 Tax=Yersinia sp. Marseille-Q3913 TaxID=2830769 RepID=UPI001BBEE5D4